MFERYTEKARRVIFFARYEASQFGSPHIESEHILLGLLREDKNLTNRFLKSHASVESIRRQIDEHTTVREKVATSVDLPLANDAKRVLAYAFEESQRLAHQHIGTEHLLLGMLREERCFAAEILKERGLKLEAVRQELQTHPINPRGQGAPGIEMVKLREDLTSAISPLGVFQIALKVKDVEASREFYARLGFRVLGMAAGNVILANGNCRIALCTGDSPGMVMSFTGSDLAGLTERLSKAGAAFEQPAFTTADGSTAALLRDPDGNAISFTFNPRGAEVVWPTKRDGR